MRAGTSRAGFCANRLIHAPVHVPEALAHIGLVLQT